MRALICVALLGIVITLSGVPQFVTAQGGDELPDLVQGEAVEVVFPAAVVFRIDLAVSEAAVNGVQLRLTQDDRTLVDGVVSAEFLDDAADDSVALYFDWPIPPDDAPTLFAELAYEWRIQLEGADLLEGQGGVMFQPGPGEWRTSGEAPLQFAVVDSNVNLRATRDVLLPAYDLLTRHTELAPELRWVIVPRDFAFCSEVIDDEGETIMAVSPESVPDVVYPCAEADAARILAEQGFALMRRGAPGLLPFQEDMLAALFDAFYADFWGQRPAPPWFRTGLQHYYGVNPDPLRLRQVQEAARAALLYSADQLRRGPLETDRYDLWSAQNAMLILYIADRFGAEAPFALAQAVTGEGVEAALAALTGQEWDAFLVEWERWLFTEAAARASAWTVYLPATATPQPTPQPTLTPTVTVTATETPVLSPTPQDLSTTVQPTLSPVTEEGPTATNTPRPPGSLETRPPAAEAAARSDTGICGAALPALWLPGFAVLVSGYRRKHA